MLPEIGLLRSDDPRFHATLDVVGKRLMKNGFMMRYVEADDFGKPSNAFLLCTFWYIDALASVGRRDEALELFNNVLARRNHVGLLSEDIDPQDRRAVGQLPANLLAGRADPVGHAPVAELGGGPMARLVIVSNRVPIPKARGAPAGGLAVALRDLLMPGTMWFGWSGRLPSEPSPQPALVEARGVTYATIDLTSEAYRGFYVGFANGALWPLLHFRLGLMHFRREDYRRLSRRSTAASPTSLGPVLQPDDTVWAHDYHLIPLGRMLREQGFARAARLLPARAVRAALDAGGACRSRASWSPISAPTTWSASRPRSMRATSATARSACWAPRSTANGCG